MAYRGPETKLRASPREAKAAREEGVTFLFEHKPLAVEGDITVTGLRCTTPTGEQRLDCDTVILALGFVADPPVWLETLGVATDEAGRIRIDAQGRTSRPFVYAGGDNTHGPDLVVTALAAGRRAAGAILDDIGVQGRLRRVVGLHHERPKRISPQPSAARVASPGEVV